MSLKYSEYVAHILVEAQFLTAQSQGLTYEKFIENDLLIRAFVRSLEIIGEASKKVPDELRFDYPEFNWKGAAGMRDKLIHHYFGIDYEIVWDIIQNEIPTACEFLDLVYQDLKNKNL